MNDLQPPPPPTTTDFLLLKVGHHYLFKSVMVVTLWKESRPDAGYYRVDSPRAVGLLSSGDHLFVVEQNFSASCYWLCWKVMTSRQEMGWIEIPRSLWESSYQQDFTEITPDESR